MNVNPFELLGLPVAFDLDPALLHQRMIQLVGANHPDRFEDPLDQADAAERAAAVNEAYRLLKHPMSRASVLLELYGRGMKLDEKKLPPELLMEMMEAREELEQAQAENDPVALDRLRSWAVAQQAQYETTLGEQLAQAIQNAAPAAEQAAHLQLAQVQLNALRYIQRMLEEFPPR
jgi:molecular chaperone HscB